jgi:serine/threonine protein kinase
MHLQWLARRAQGCGRLVEKLTTYRLPPGCLPLCLCSAKDCISKLLVVDPTKRLSASEALEHDFIKAGSFPPAAAVDADR